MAKNKGGCVFCHKIQRLDGIRHEYGNARSSDIVSFEPLNPVVEGHRLFVPTFHIERDTRRLDDLGLVFALAHRYGQTEGVDFNLIQSNGSDATQTVDHLHIHYVPRARKDGLTLPWTEAPDIRLDMGILGKMFGK